MDASNPSGIKQRSAVAAAPRPDTLGIQFLSSLPEDALLDADALSGAFGVNARALSRMVKRGELPPGVKVGGKPIWTAGVLRKHIQKRSQQAAQEAERRRERVHRLMPRRSAG